MADVWQTLHRKMQGHYQYYGVSDNWEYLLSYRDAVVALRESGLEDAVKETDRQDDLRVRDIAEVIAANLVVGEDAATPDSDPGA